MQYHYKIYDHKDLLHFSTEWINESEFVFHAGPEITTIFDKTFAVVIARIEEVIDRCIDAKAVAYCVIGAQVGDGKPWRFLRTIAVAVARGSRLLREGELQPRNRF